MRFKPAIGACALGSILCCVATAPARAEAVPPADVQPDDLADLSIEQLAQLTVRSASKRDEPLSSAPAALYVITSEDIHSSGAMSLPEALRLAPNLQVQQVDASQYSISARGFNGLQAGNKVLALIDGRSIYTPLDSSVFWQLHSPLLEDVEQIEVISGPGGTLYGPNAVNGVINITTRDAQDTIGTLVRGTAGPDQRTAAARFGFALGQSGAMRLYANWHDDDGLPAGLAPDIDDAYRGWQTGFRSDFVTEADHFTLQGDLFHDDADTLPGDGANGHNLLARWSRTLGTTSSFELQAYYDYFKRRFALVDDSLQTGDVEGQFNATLGQHDLVAGLGVRTTHDQFINAQNFFQLNPPRKRLWTGNAFLQDHLRVTQELSLIAGVKVERSSFSGWQVLPNLRVAWQPGPRSLWWAAVSRAVRTPSRIDRQLEALPFLQPAPEFTSEKLVAAEIGYRGQPSATTSFSINGFVNFYDDLRTTEFVDGAFMLANGAKGRTYGVEAWGNAQVTPSWRVALGASTLWKDLKDKPGRLDLAPRNSLGNDPSWQLTGRSDWDLAPRLQLTLDARAVGRIEMDPEIGSYVEAGGQLAYQATEAIELFVAGRNLLHRTHLESNDPGAAQRAKRTVYAGARARF
jgi:iron complex outermembrane receptor protein